VAAGSQVVPRQTPVRAAQDAPAQELLPQPGEVNCRKRPCWRICVSA